MNQTSYHSYCVARQEELSPLELSNALSGVHQVSHRSDASSVNGFAHPGHYSEENETFNHYEQARREEDERFYAQFPEARQHVAPDTHAYYVDDQGHLCSTHGHYVPSALGYDDVSSMGNVLSPARTGYRDDEWTSHAPSVVAGSFGNSSSLSNALAESTQDYALYRMNKDTLEHGHDVKTCDHSQGDYRVDSEFYNRAPINSAIDANGLLEYEVSHYHTSGSPDGHSSSSLPPLSPTTSSGSTSPIPSSQTTKLPIPPLPNSRGRSHKRSNTLPLRRTFGPKPALACYFCRGRKIACGMPPDPDSNGERTCNQCQRRSLKCVFPTEIRRSPRRAKDESSEPGSRGKPRRRNTVSGPSTAKAEAP